MAITERHGTNASGDALKRGIRLGARVGALVCAVPGVIAGIYLSGPATAFLLARYGYVPPEPGIGLRVLLVLGTVAGIGVLVTLALVGGAALGAVAAYGIHHTRELILGEAERAVGSQRPLHMNFHAEMSERAREEIRGRLSFLMPVSDGIRSVVITGSAAYKKCGPHSDIDIVVISKDSVADGVREYTFGAEIEDAMAEQRLMADLEFTVLSESETIRLFKAGSAFAYAIRHGVWIQDEGLRNELRVLPLPTVPTKEFQLTMFHDHVAVQYLGAMAALETDIARKNCTRSCCMDKEDCEGISPADDLSKTILRMLYIVLPAEGYMPLTKSDVVEFAGRVYGGQSVDAIRNAISISRSGKRTVRFGDYESLKRLAAMLFQDVLSHVEQEDEASRILNDARNLVEGRTAEIQGSALRNCIM